MSFLKKKILNSNVRCVDPIRIGLKELHTKFQVNRTVLDGEGIFDDSNKFFLKCTEKPSLTCFFRC